MKEPNSTEEIRGYCAQCLSNCPTIACVRDGIFVEVKPDEQHPNASQLCPKGLAGPELVYNKQRLKYPMRRTRPKGDPDPGWERISWDEALDTIATRLNEIKAKWGPEALVISRCGIGGAPIRDFYPWLKRLTCAFGTPNMISTTHICQWHRDNGSAYTYGGIWRTMGEPDFPKAACILIWGHNPHANNYAGLRDIKQGLEQGARLIMVDPRQTDLAAMADLHLQVRPATDGALVLSMLKVMIDEKLYDHDFVRDWTTAPLLVRSDTGNILRVSDLRDGADPSHCVMVDSTTGNPVTCIPGTMLPMEPILDTIATVKLAGGNEVECKTAFRLLRELVSDYPPNIAEEITGVPADKIRDAVRMFTTNKPACWYCGNGIEQDANATQTNRALCIFYALTGNYDKPGGNVMLPSVPSNQIQGLEFLSPETREKCLGYHKRPLGSASTTLDTQAYEVFEAILTGKPYPVKAFLGFGGNFVTSNPPTLLAREALMKLDFHAHCELFLSPTAEFADIVLPAASFWETWHVKVDFSSPRARDYIQLRPAIVPPQHESWPDHKVIFELAKRLGLGDKFWDGDIEAAHNYRLAPSGITVEQLRKNHGGISLDLPVEYQKYSKKDADGNFLGLPTPSKRVEIYSQVFKDHGYNPLPVWKEPFVSRFARTSLAEKYPLILISEKALHYCHSQHRALPSLRKAVPYPCLEMNPQTAREIPCQDGDWIILETPHGSITMKAKVTDSILYNVVCTQHGWWQGCPELNLPAYDPYSPEGANVNLIYDVEELDPVSGCFPIKGYPCNIRKKETL